MHQKIFILIALCSMNSALAMQEHSRRKPDLVVVVPGVAPLAREETLSRVPTPFLDRSDEESLPPLSDRDKSSWPGTPTSHKEFAHSRSSTAESTPAPTEWRPAALPARTTPAVKKRKPLTIVREKGPLPESASGAQVTRAAFVQQVVLSMWAK